VELVKELNVQSMYIWIRVSKKEQIKTGMYIEWTI